MRIPPSPVALLGLKGCRRHTLLLPFSEEFESFLRGRLEESIRHNTVAGFTASEIERFTVGQVGRTIVLGQLTSCKTRGDLSGVRILAEAAKLQFTVEAYIAGFTTVPASALIHTLFGFLNPDGKRVWASQPLRNGDILWGIDFRPGERMAMLEVECTDPPLDPDALIGANDAVPAVLRRVGT